MSNTPAVIQYLDQVNAREASDLYLTVGFPPTMRIEGELVQIKSEALTIEDINDILASVLTNRQRREFESTLELNTSLDVGKYGRFRVNVLKQRQAPALVLRRIISQIPSFAELHLPALLGDLALEKRGLILVTGMTGSGKSTTLASMIDCRNAKEQGHIITIEDPIEYFHDHKKSVITQREVGVDTESYAIALKNALRQRPDVILVGEIRDREVMEQALTAAETGHLCLATLHTTNAYQSIERVVNMFHEHHQHQIRQNLSMNLKAIISQRLVPSTDSTMALAIEIMLNQGLIRELIHKGEISKIRDVMERNSQQGMCTFDQSFLLLYQQGRITEETAISQSDKPAEMEMSIRKIKFDRHGRTAGEDQGSPEDKFFSDSEKTSSL